MSQHGNKNSTTSALSQSHADVEQIIDEENDNQNEDENENEKEDEEEENEEANENEVEEIGDDEVQNMESKHEGKIYGSAEEK